MTQPALSIVSLAFIPLSVLIFLWAIIGFPLGLVLLVIYFFQKRQIKKLKLKRWLKICCGGVLGLIIIIILNILFNNYGINKYYSGNISCKRDVSGRELCHVKGDCICLGKIQIMLSDPPNPFCEGILFSCETIKEYYLK